MSINFNDLQAFRAVVEHGSFRRASTPSRSAAGHAL
ncbi:LysR family transcriptional regulator [Pseudomonas sp. zfem004]|nr:MULTISPECIES: LysR family transcriptional regulator [unclassified Pseudomonas]MDU9402004.1 LysR family transcriptional regulator [Pseudomonas sp. zfem004]